MELEKSNETVWSIKRRGIPGNFILRSTEQAGDIIRVSISLEENGKIVTFEMKYPEFINFYGILSSFKALIESPAHRQARRSSMEEIQMMKEDHAKNIAFHEEGLLSQKEMESLVSEEEALLAEEEALSEAEMEEDIDYDENIDSEKKAKLDEGLKNLDALFSSISKSEENQEQRMMEKSPKQVSSVSIPIPSLTKQKNHSSANETAEQDIASKKNKLRETDWDPW